LHTAGEIALEPELGRDSGISLRRAMSCASMQFARISSRAASIFAAAAPILSCTAWKSRIFMPL
jgi:hypothetical protein